MTWNGCGVAVGPQRNRLAVQNQGRRRECTRRIDDLRHRNSDIAQAARVDPDLVARFVQLDAGTIQLVFEIRRTDFVDRGVDVAGRPGQHRLHRSEQRDVHGTQRRFAVDQRRHRHRRQRPRYHRRPSHPLDRNRRRAGNRVEEHAFHGALAQFPVQQPHEEILFDRGGRGEQAAQHAHALRGGAGAAYMLQSVEHRIDVGEGKRRL